MKVVLLVHEHGGEYFAIRYFPPDKPISSGKKIFELEKELSDPDAVNALEAEAREEARRRGLDKVVNLNCG